MFFFQSRPQTFVGSLLLTVALPFLASVPADAATLTVTTTSDLIAMMASVRCAKPSPLPTLASDGVLTITDSSFTGNTATDGGAIFNGRQSVSSTFKPGELRLLNTILDGNSAACPELLGIGNQGGGLFNPAGATLFLQGGAISNNTASVGGGIWNGGTIALRQGTEIENNTPDDCLNDGGTGCELLFNDDFESGDLTAWSATVR